MRIPLPDFFYSLMQEIFMSQKGNISNNIDFKIIISFAEGKQKLIHKCESEYNEKHKDSVTINGNEIIIEGHRGKTEMFISLCQKRDYKKFYNSTVKI